MSFDSNVNFSNIFDTLTKVNQRMVEDFTKNMTGIYGAPENRDQPHTHKTLLGALMNPSEGWMGMQSRYYQKQMDLWLSMFGAQPGDQTNPIVVPDKSDRRFSAPEWNQYPFFSYLKQYYLLTADLLTGMVNTAKLDEETKNKVMFFTRQYIDAMSPSNFPITNPEVLKIAIDTNGESLAEGLKNMVEDLKKGRISMTDESAFEVGKNLATTPGAVVFENDLIQLIQYTPTTDKVYERPVLMVPPCINKYYLMDMQPDNSLVRYVVSQGFTVFMVSWRNLPTEMRHYTWDDYLSIGVTRAIEVAKDITGADKINTLGFCIGGTLLASDLAVLRAKRHNLVSSMTLMTTLIEFSDVGEIGLFVDQDLVCQRERDLASGKDDLVKGKELALTFAALRANDLIWHYVVNNYLKGRTPEAFDLLYWNSDSTNLPRPMHTYFMRNMYLEDNLVKPGKLSMCGVPVDISKINLPTYIFAAREDHIVPWKTAYAATKYLKGDITFVLGASGHIAGPINPASKNKRNFWVGGEMTPDSDHWLESAQSEPGSWWPHWTGWLAKLSGKQIPASELGSEDFPVLEPAPGSYVKVRCEDN